MIFSTKGKKEQKAEALRSMKRDIALACLDPLTTNYAQMFNRAYAFDTEPTLRSTQTRCSYCGNLRSRTTSSCDGCGGHL